MSFRNDKRSLSRSPSRSKSRSSFLSRSGSSSDSKSRSSSSFSSASNSAFSSSSISISSKFSEKNRESRSSFKDFSSKESVRLDEERKSDSKLALLSNAPKEKETLDKKDEPKRVIDVLNLPEKDIPFNILQILISIDESEKKIQAYEKKIEVNLKSKSKTFIIKPIYH